MGKAAEERAPAPPCYLSPWWAGQGPLPANAVLASQSHGAANTVPAGTCISYLTLLLGMTQRAWVGETNLGADPMFTLTGCEILGKLSNFVAPTLSSEKRMSVS